MPRITCDPNAKKLEWHMCLQDAVEYKRGMKTETRDECKVDKIVKLTNGCDFGDLYKHVPAGADLGKVRFYAKLGEDGHPRQEDALEVPRLRHHQVPGRGRRAGRSGREEGIALRSSSSRAVTAHGIPPLRGS